MEEIRLGLEKGLDVSKYTNLKYNWKKTKEIREDLKSNLVIYLKDNITNLKNKLDNNK